MNIQVLLALQPSLCMVLPHDEYIMPEVSHDLDEYSCSNYPSTKILNKYLPSISPIFNAIYQVCI